MDWLAAQERLRAPIFAPLRAALARLPADRWPTHDDLNGGAGGIATAAGVPIRFMPPGKAAVERVAYESRIARTGEVVTRPENWHDLFNALAWIAWPKAKARINAQHAALIAQAGADASGRRSPERDALTLFDEGGIAIASTSPELMGLVVDFRWKDLFWHRRAELAERMAFLAFGHGLHEQSLAPYLGMVAKTVFVPVDELFFMLPLESRVARVDALLDAHFAQRVRFESPKRMAPMPVLGVPGWHPGTALESFYDDREHFRGKTPKPPKR